MRQQILAVSLLTLTVLAHAQAPIVLIEACNNIADADKRLECLKAAMGAGSAAAQALPLAAVNRAFAGMEASINTGISYNNYQVAVLDLAKAVAAYQQDGGEAAGDSAKLFESALDAYSDAGTFWARSIDFYARRDNNIAYAGGLPVSMTGMDWLVRKYGLPTGKSDIWGIERGLPVDSTRSALWRIAHERTVSAQAATKQTKPDEAFANLSMPYVAAGFLPERTTARLIAIGAACHADPFIATVSNTPARKEFSTKCDSGQVLNINCAEGLCQGKLSE